MSIAGMSDEIIAGKHVYLSRHAIVAAQQRGFSLDEVFATLRSWETRYVQARRYGSDDATPYMYQRGDIGVAVVETEHMILVKTVLLREVNQWDDDDARARRRSVVTAIARSPR